MGTCYSSVTKSCVKPKKNINIEKSIQEICVVAAKNGNLNTIKSAYKEVKLDNLELEEVFCLSAEHDNLNIIEWGFEEKILNNMEKILYIASINENSGMIQYLILNYEYDNINIYNTFIISAFNGNYYIIKWLDDNYSKYL